MPSGTPALRPLASVDRSSFATPVARLGTKFTNRLDGHVLISFCRPMSTVKPSRIPIAMRRRGCETVEQMHHAGWDVIACCDACMLIMRVSLPTIIKVRGPTFSLWNRKARCRRFSCVGFVEFRGRAPGMECHDPLTAPWPDHKPPLFALGVPKFGGITGGGDISSKNSRVISKA